MQLELGTNGMEDMARGLLKAQSNLNMSEASGEPTISAIRVIDKFAPKYAAHQCSIRPCVKTYAARIHKGLSTETTETEYIIERSTRTGDYYAGNYQVADLTCTIDTVRQHLQNMGYNLQVGQRWTTWDVMLYPNETKTIMLYPEGFTGTCEHVPKDRVDEYCKREQNNAQATVRRDGSA
jgi:hypothetical protein